MRALQHFNAQHYMPAFFRASTRVVRRHPGAHARTETQRARARVRLRAHLGSRVITSHHIMARAWMLLVTWALACYIISYHILLHRMISYHGGARLDVARAAGGLAAAGLVAGEGLGVVTAEALGQVRAANNILYIYIYIYNKLNKS
jgi:hypothetical protein